MKLESRASNSLASAHSNRDGLNMAPVAVTFCILN